MTKLSILRTLSLLAIFSPLVEIDSLRLPSVIAAESSQNPTLHVTLGEQYTGALTPSATNPQGEVCYKLAVKPNTRITLKAKTSGIGILKFAVYDQTKALQFFHNTANNQSKSTAEAAAEAGFSFPLKSAGSQLCLTTTNPHDGQKYEFTITGKPNRGIRVRQSLRPATPSLASLPTATLPKSPPIEIPPPPPPIETQPAPAVKIPPPPTIQTKPSLTVKVPQSPPEAAGSPAPDKISPPVVAVATAPAKPYCYVGTWQINDLSPYWLPMVQNFTQAKVSNPRMVGYAKITITKDGRSLFEAFDLEQKYTLKSKDTGAKLDNLEFSLGGRATARFKENSDSSLTFDSQSYRRLTSKLNLGKGMELNGEKLFTVFGDRDSPQIPMPYQCIDSDNIVLKLPLPVGKQLVPISLKRIN